MMKKQQQQASEHEQPFDFAHIFIGREQQLIEFERALREWKQSMARHAPEDTPLSSDLPSPASKLEGLVVMLYGRGGFGKTILLKHYYEIAVLENEQGFQGTLTICGPIDWEIAIEGKRAIYNPSPGQALDATAYFRDLSQILAQALGKQPKDFRIYQQAAQEVEKGYGKDSFLRQPYEPLKS